MMRQAIFGLVLVGAAFAGGAAINGPGLAWLQRTVAGGPSIIVDGAPGAPAAKQPKQFPTAAAPPLVVDLGSRPSAAPKPPDGAPPVQAEPPAGAAPDFALAPIAPAPDSPPLAFAPAPVDPAPLPPLDLPPDHPAAAKADPVARLASAGGPEVDPAPASVSTPAPAPARDWLEIRGRMKALGVSRYTVEGEADGRVRFSCVIPVPGVRAVGHHFEAEGDDEYGAAEAALRRVALWRATESR